ncbi:Uncharacterized conserved protein YndB, AHSA1/START domain [Thalassolituus maritimus]|uniref:Uncharacterized conserved protein YndB, AHSA1/START domain n=1 Tax=Thalassolituus maritimus TaxID=484498 RepID=A0A1N7PMX9_9GAMM|nr:SRPBCC family protein [Thalassolituus maritimus]SIT11941.1 Uncharacterized conserved protein YndB, AHSA1/START domain [Thalassolituus maritimus]
MANEVHLYRVIKAPAERIYNAFVIPEALVKWNPPHGFVAKIHHMDARVGGTYKMSFINLGCGEEHSFGGTYREMIPGEKLVFDDQFDHPDLPGQMITTVTFTPVLNGTAMTVVQTGIPEAIPLEFCYAGWQESLQLLMQLVEPEIPSQFGGDA